MFEKEKKERANAKQDNRVASQAVGKAFPTRRFKVFLDRQCPDIACAATIQIAGSGVMNGMFPRPLTIRRQRQNAGDKTDDIVRLARGQK